MLKNSWKVITKRNVMTMKLIFHFLFLFSRTNQGLYFSWPWWFLTQTHLKNFSQHHFNTKPPKKNNCSGNKGQSLVVTTLLSLILIVTMIGYLLPTHLLVILMIYLAIGLALAINVMPVCHAFATPLEKTPVQSNGLIAKCTTRPLVPKVPTILMHNSRL